MPINELSFDIGFDASEFRKGIEQATKDVDKFVRKTLGKRAGIVQGLTQFGSQAIKASSLVPGLTGGPIQRSISQGLWRYGGIGATSAMGGGAALAGGLGISAVAGAGLLGSSFVKASDRRAEYVRQQAEDARRTLRPVSSLNYGSVNQRDVADISLQDERFARARAKFGRDTAPFRQNFRGAIASIAEATANTFTGDSRSAVLARAAAGPLVAAYGAARDLPRIGDIIGSAISGGQQLPQYTQRETRRMDEQMSERERRMEAIRQANRDDALIWEIR